MTTPQQVLSDDEIIGLISPWSNNSASHDIDFAKRIIDAALAKLQAAPQAELSKESRTINGHMQHAIKLASRIDGADELIYTLGKVAEHIDRLTVELGVLAMKGPQTIQAAPQAQADDRIQFRGICDSSEMMRVRQILEGMAIYLDGKTINAIVQAAQQPAQGVGEVVSKQEATRLLNALIEGGALPDESMALLRGLVSHPTPSPEAVPDADPLQGAANWLTQAVDNCQPSNIAGRLSIGYNRASRLHEAALSTQQAQSKPTPSVSGWVETVGTKPPGLDWGDGEQAHSKGGN